jgi:hypothetical protein
MEKKGFENYGFQTVFGFTYSIFIRHGTTDNTPTTDPSNQYITHLLEDCQHQLNVKIEIEHKNRFLFTIIFDKKNHYITWTGKPEDRPIAKNLDGMNRKYYPPWIKQQIQKIATYLIIKSDVDVMRVIKQTFEDLDHGRFDAKDMQFTEEPDKYPNSIQMIKTSGLRY